MLPEGWTRSRLGDVLTLQRGFDLPIQDRKPGPFPIVSSSGTTGTHAEPRAHGPGVVTGRYGTIGQVFYVPGDYWPLNTTLYVKDFKGNHPRFCAYLLETLDFQAHNDKSSVPGVNRNHLHEEMVTVPPLSEQVQIAAVGGLLDDQMEGLAKMNQTLEAMARARFRSWFVDFEPVRAKMEGRPTGLPTDEADLFPDHFTDSALGPVPSGWAVRALGDVVEVGGGSTPSTKEPSYWDGSHGWATPRDLAPLSSPVLLRTERTLTDEGVAQTTSGLLPPGTVLLSSRAPIGYLAITEVPVAVNQGFITMVCGGNPSNHFMLHWTRHYHDAIVARANGTTFLEISKKNFRPMQLLVPPNQVMDAFTAAVEPLHRRVVANLRQSDTLAALRDALLPKLLSGEVRIPEPVEVTA